MKLRPWVGAAMAAWLVVSGTGPAWAQAPETVEPRSDPSGETFPVTLGSFSTTLIGSLPARTANIQLSVRAIDGLVLRPGEQFSFNDVVGERSTARGYQRAPVILHETRQLQLGGGICQTASTLFVAALLSGLSIAERHRHSFPVDYIPLAEDATIAWGVKDLRIRNDLDQPVRLRLQVLGMTLSARIEAEEGIAERFELETIEREAPSADDVLPAREIELYRLRLVDGDRVDRELVHRDVYPPTLARLPAPRGAAPR